MQQGRFALFQTWLASIARNLYVIDTYASEAYME